MSHIVHVAVPVVRAKTHLELQKGQPWSIVEHLVLGAAANRGRTLDALSSGFQLPRPLMSAALMRLVRADWVESQLDEDGSLMFIATEAGVAAAARRELPYRYVVAKTTRSHLYERLYGHVFRLDELSHFSPNARPSRGADEIVAEITDAILPEGLFRIDEIEDVLLDDDEVAVGVRPGLEYQSERVVFFTVVDGSIINLPLGRDLADLETRILRAAVEALAHERRRGPVAVPKSEEWEPPKTNALKFLDMRFEPDDLVLGAQPHQRAIERALKLAQSRVIIHSTFLGKKSIGLLLELMKDAVAQRNVTIDVLWGQKEESEDRQSRRKNMKQDRPTAAEIVAELEKDASLAPYRRRLRFHTQSTDSHAKVIVFDPVQRGRYVALLGSCNWLASTYGSVEASVYLRSACIVRELLKVLARAVYAGAGLRTTMVETLLKMARQLPPDPPGTLLNASAALVVDDAHVDCMYRMCEQAERTVLLVSHRLGPVARPGALAPLAAACAKSLVKARVFYGKLEAERLLLTQWEADARRHGISLVPIKKPRVHAKFLAWDEDHAVISSQNWLSADPGESHLVKELGVMIDAPGIGTLAMTRFDDCVRKP